MKTSFLIFASMGVLAFAFPNHLDDFNKANHIIDLNSKEFKKVEEETLKKAEKEIAEQNEKFKKGTGKFAEKLNPYSDLPMDKFIEEKGGVVSPDARMTGAVAPPENMRNSASNREKMKQVYSKMNSTQLPESYDSRTKGFVTPVKNQGNCGSCCAFAAHAGHEICMAKAGAKIATLDLSEQYLIDCGYDGTRMRGCKNAQPHAYQDWFASKGGVAPHESYMQYLDKSPKLTCPSEVKLWNSGSKVTEAMWDYDCNADKMKYLIHTFGYATGVLNTEPRLLNYYKGILDGCEPTTEYNHAVTYVGYGTENGTDYWIVKNSWGDRWGAQGYFKLLRGKNMCNSESICIVSKCESTGTPDYLPTTTVKPIAEEIAEVNKTTCDVYTYFGGSIDIGYKVRLDDDETVYDLVCEDSICWLKGFNPDNVCMYICKKKVCDTPMWEIYGMY